MKTLIITLTVVCAAVAYYFGLRYFTGQDLGFTPARKYVRNLAENLLHTELTAAREAVFVRFHPSKSEQGLLLYSESLAGSADPDESRRMMFRLKTSAGWKR